MSLCILCTYFIFQVFNVAFVIFGMRRADVVLTDLPEVLPLLERNILENSGVWKPRGRAIAKVLKWELSEDATGTLSPIIGSLDILLLADCVYYTEVGFCVFICT